MYSYIKDSKYGIKLLQFDCLKEQEGIAHCFTTRQGGVSEGHLSSLNMSFNREKENRENVLENIKRTAETCGVPFESLTMVPQIHSAKVKVVTAQDMGRGVSREPFDEGYDAMVTNVPGVTLCTIHGDCIPVFIYDSKNKACGMVHSGWRGTCGRIAAKTVEAMKENYGSKYSDLNVVIGPGICIDCFEVSQDVIDAYAEQFDTEFMADEEVFRRDETREGKWFVSLPEIVYRSLCDIGVPKENITKSNICTCCEENKETFFSHRRENGKTGAMSGFIGLKG